MISVFVAQYITATGHTKVLHILKILLSAITLVFSEPLMTSNRYPAERFGRAQNGPTFDRQNTIFAASKPLDEIASGRLNPNIWDHWGINKHIRQNYFLVHIHFKYLRIKTYCEFKTYCEQGGICPWDCPEMVKTGIKLCITIKFH